MGEIDMCRIGTGAGSFFLKGSGIDNFVLFCLITYHTICALSKES